MSNKQIYKSIQQQIIVITIFMNKNKTLIITGASGVGKGTIIAHLFQKHKDILSFVMSYTTRSPRKNQINNVHYRFVTHEKFDQCIPEMLEHKNVFGNKYGTCKMHHGLILKQNKIPILDIDIEGALEIKPKIDCEVLCIMPPSYEVLAQRLQGRKSESEQSFKRRMKDNQQQIKKMYSLQGNKNINFITNYQFQLTVYGIELWMCQKFTNFAQHYKKTNNKPGFLGKK